MTMYARVEQGVVRELVETDQRIEELYHPDLLWVNVQGLSGVCPGWIARREGFAPPEPEAILAATPAVDITDLSRRVNELQEQIRMLAADANGVHPGEV